MNPSPSRPPPPRLVPDEPLPPYAYVTARFPHPTREPAGHSFGHQSPTPPPVEIDRWRDSRSYLVGCDLFNHGYYWEAHETWEGLWVACGRKGTTADFLKGLIKLAAAGVKAREGRSPGVARHAARAAALFRLVRRAIDAPRYLGLCVADLIAVADDLPGHTSAAHRNAPVEIVFDFHLIPEPVRDNPARG